MRDNAGFLLLFFDFPMTEKKDRKNYNVFIRFLKREGYLPLQESVYVKYLRRLSSARREIEKVRPFSTEENHVALLPLGADSFSKIESFGEDLLDRELLCDDVITA